MAKCLRAELAFDGAGCGGVGHGEEIGEVVVLVDLFVGNEAGEDDLVGDAEIFGELPKFRLEGPAADDEVFGGWDLALKGGKGAKDAGMAFA